MKKFLFNRIIACIVMFFCSGVPGYCQDVVLPIHLSYDTNNSHGRNRMLSSFRVLCHYDMAPRLCIYRNV